MPIVIEAAGYWLTVSVCATQRFAESGIGNRESGIGNRESGIGNRASRRLADVQCKRLTSCAHTTAA
ncbi:hypothetical protein NX08_006610 [Xanthomonas vasicola]|nr:hypothetical protein NX08_006610 [Xanthomonas vasicola]